MTGPATPFIRLLQATVTVRDVPRAVAWYRDVLGMTVRKEQHMRIAGHDYRWTDVAFGDQEAGITLCEALPQADGSPPPTPGRSSMVALEVADCDAAVGLVEETGGKVLAPPARFEGMRVAIVRDPEGNPLSLMERH